jgi:hypothetical protein
VGTVVHAASPPRLQLYAPYLIAATQTGRQEEGKLLLQAFQGKGFGPPSHTVSGAFDARLGYC